ncbi:MAG: glycosyltransferase family 2 protein [Candidatus Lokiarchaeota archaeon]|nr:glycosyltransferase family 2 protein [Candidatus Harpocratesius repetitus]
MNSAIESSLISVIIPSFNRQSTIKRAIESVLNQTYQNFEIIVVDDCSKDKTVSIIRSLMKDYSNIQLIVNSKNMGPNFTRNRGIKAASGEYIILLDSDDDWRPEMLELLLLKLQKSPKKVGFVFPGMTLIQPGLNRNILPKYSGKVFKEMLTQGVIGVYPLIKREVFKKVGLFDESEILRQGGHQDYEMWIRIALYYECEYVSKPLLNHYVHKSSITYESLIKKPFTKIWAYLYIWKKYKSFIKDDIEIYQFFCYKIFELLCLAKSKRLARNVIFMALKKKIFVPRTYYHLVFYLHDFYSPIKFLESFKDFARLIKEFVQRFLFRLKS